MRSRLEYWKSAFASWKDVATTFQSVTTVIALIVGAWWTYTIFIQSRQDRPRIAITHSVGHLRISEGHTLLMVSEKLTNVGTTAVEPQVGLIHIDQVLPVADSAKEKLTKAFPGQSLSEDESCVKLNAKGEVDNSSFEKCIWPVLAFHMHHWEKTGADYNRLLLEPGEVDTIQTFFIIPDSVQVVHIYSSVKNTAEATSNAPVAWSAVTTYDLRESQQKSISSTNP